MVSVNALTFRASNENKGNDSWHFLQVILHLFSARIDDMTPQSRKSNAKGTRTNECIALAMWIGRDTRNNKTHSASPHTKIHKKNLKEMSLLAQEIVKTQVQNHSDSPRPWHALDVVYCGQSLALQHNEYSQRIQPWRRLRLHRQRIPINAARNINGRCEIRSNLVRTRCEAIFAVSIRRLVSGSDFETFSYRRRSTESVWFSNSSSKRDAVSRSVFVCDEFIHCGCRCQWLATVLLIETMDRPNGTTKCWPKLQWYCSSDKSQSVCKCWCRSVSGAAVLDVYRPMRDLLSMPYVNTWVRMWCEDQSEMNKCPLLYFYVFKVFFHFIPIAFVQKPEWTPFQGIQQRCSTSA